MFLSNMSPKTTRVQRRTASAYGMRTYLRAHDLQPRTRVPSKVRARGHRARRPRCRVVARRHKYAVVRECRERRLVLLLGDRHIGHVRVDAQPVGPAPSLESGRRRGRAETARARTHAAAFLRALRRDASKQGARHLVGRVTVSAGRARATVRVRGWRSTIRAWGPAGSRQLGVNETAPLAVRARPGHPECLR